MRIDRGCACSCVEIVFENPFNDIIAGSIEVERPPAGGIDAGRSVFSRQGDESVNVALPGHGGVGNHEAGKLVYRLSYDAGTLEKVLTRIVKIRPGPRPQMIWVVDILMRLLRSLVLGDKLMIEKYADFTGICGHKDLLADIPFGDAVA